MKITGFLLLMTLGICVCKAQSTFSVIVKDTVYDHQIGDALELTSGNFIIVDTKNLGPSDYASRLLKISPKGKILQDQDISFQALSSCLVSVNTIAGNKILLSGTVRTSGLSKLWLCVLDTSLNVIENKILALENYNYFISKVRIADNNDILCFGFVKDTTSYQDEFSFIYKFSPNLDSLKLKIFSDKWSWGLDLIERDDHNGYYFVVVGYSSAGGSSIISLDTAFYVQRVIKMPDNVDNMCSIKYIDSTHLLITGEYSYDWPSIDKRDIGVLKYDTLFNLIRTKAFGKKDTEDFPGISKNIAISDRRHIYIGGTDNMAGYEFSVQDSWYILNNIDTALNLNWQKYYGGDGFYTLYGIIPTKDSGCLMFGTLWDYHNTQKYTRYLSLIKVTKDGLLLSINGEPGPLMHLAIVYPNPGSNMINIQTQLKSSVFNLYDLTGREVGSLGLIPGRNAIQVQNLKSGLYIYKISQNSDVIEFGKWLKE